MYESFQRYPSDEFDSLLERKDENTTNYLENTERAKKYFYTHLPSLHLTSPQKFCPLYRLIAKTHYMITNGIFPHEKITKERNRYFGQESSLDEMPLRRHGGQDYQLIIAEIFDRKYTGSLSGETDFLTLQQYISSHYNSERIYHTLRHMPNLQSLTILHSQAKSIKHKSLELNNTSSKYVFRIIRNFLYEIFGDTTNKDNIVERLATAYQYFIRSEFFSAVNNSFFWNIIINPQLEKYGIQPVPHGIMDHFAFHIQEEDFPKYFAEHIMKHQS